MFKTIKRILAERRYHKRRDKFATWFYWGVDVYKKAIPKSIYHKEVEKGITLLKKRLRDVCMEGLFSKEECVHFYKWLKKEVEEDGDN